MKIDRIFFIAGGDLRQLYLAKVLADHGNKVYITGFDGAFELDKRLIPLEHPSWIGMSPDCIILPLPVSNDGVTLNTPFSRFSLALSEVLDTATSHTMILGGKMDASLKRYCDERTLDWADYLDREEFAVMNAVPTAEGAIEILMQELPTTLYGTSCLILGYGRIGKVLSRDLRALGVTVGVAARKCADLSWVEIGGYKPVHIYELSRYAGDYDMIVNTVPVKLLNYDVLSRLKEHCLVLDLASKPGGVDFELAKQLGIRVIWALSLPGKVAPVTSGEILCSTVENILAERGDCT